MGHPPVDHCFSAPSIEACLGELRRNRSLRTLIGIESDSQVPKKWNMSRFLDVLGTEPHLSLLREPFATPTHGHCTPFPTSHLPSQ